MSDAVAWFDARFTREGTAARAHGEKAYLKSELRFHGVTTPQIRRACAEFCAANPLGRDGARAFVDAMYATDWFDLRSAGLLCAERSRALDGRDLPWLIGLVRRSANWAQVDFIATKLIGQIFAREPGRLSVSEKWRRDRSLWVRRAAVIAQLDELRAGRGDLERFEAVAAALGGEREFFIAKAVGWALREISKKRPSATLAFLQRHQVAPLTFREGSRRLPAAMRKQLNPPAAATIRNAPRRGARRRA